VALPLRKLTIEDLLMAALRAVRLTQTYYGGLAPCLKNSLLEIV